MGVNGHRSRREGSGGDFSTISARTSLQGLQSSRTGGDSVCSSGAQGMGVVVGRLYDGTGAGGEGQGMLM